MNVVRFIDRRAALLLIGAAFAGARAVAPAWAATPGIANEDGLAIKGYDPVAYWTEGRPLKGDLLVTYRWGGVEWRFSSSANRDLFIQNPEKFLPQFGGYCSYGMSLGRPLQPDPTQWRIVQDKLYLHNNANALQRWVQDIPGMIAKANDNWPKVKAAP